MGTILAGSLIDRVSKDLHDDGNVRWGRSTLLAYLNDGQIEIVNSKPDAYTITTAFKLSAGSKQSVPPNCIQLQNIVRNMGTDGQTPGDAITLVSMRYLDLVSPGWHSANASDSVIHWMFDERNPKVFWVYPKNTGNGYVEAVLGAVPPDVVSESAAIVLDDIYRNALYHYMLYRAYSLDADFASNAEIGNLHYNSFLRSLTLREQREQVEKPVVSIRGGFDGNVK